MDVVYLMDSSSSIHSKTFELLKNFVTSSLLSFTISPDKQSTHVSIATYGDDTKMVADFNDGTSRQRVIGLVDDVKALGGVRDLNKALEFTYNDIFSSRFGSRPSAEKFLMVFIGNDKKVRIHFYPAFLE